MEATVTIKLPDGTTRTLELAQVSLQTTYATELVPQSEPLFSMLARVYLTGTIVSGSLAAGAQ